MEAWRADGVFHAKLTEKEIASPVDLHGAFEDLIFQQGERRIVVDLSDVQMLTSLMIGALVSLHLLAYENVVILTFEHVHPKIHALFRLIGVDRLMESHYGRAAARGAPGPDPAQKDT